MYQQFYNKIKETYLKENKTKNNNKKTKQESVKTKKDKKTKQKTKTPPHFQIHVILKHKTKTKMFSHTI